MTVPARAGHHRKAMDGPPGDARYNDYGYTDDWVAHLCRSLSDVATYDFLFARKGAGPQLKLANGGSAA